MDVCGIAGVVIGIVIAVTSSARLRPIAGAVILIEIALRGSPPCVYI